MSVDEWNNLIDNFDVEWQRGAYRNREFQLKWEQVIRERPLRWGDKVAGWWFDDERF